MPAKKIIDEFTDLDISAHKKWKLRHPEDSKKSDRERRIRQITKNPLRYMLKGVKGRAKKRGIEFNITENDLIWPEFCPVLGYKLIRNSKKGWADNTHSLDRIDNKKGYIPGNVKVISWRANSIKGDATIEELEAVVKYMKDNLIQENAPFAANSE